MTSRVCILLAILCVVAQLIPGLPRAQTESKQEHVEKTLKSLKWIHGPATGRISSEAVISIPKGYVFLNSIDSKKFQALSENISAGDEYLFMPEDFRWYAIFRYEDTGFVKDDEKIDADAVLESVKTGTEAANKIRSEKGWKQLHVVGWQMPPRYDPNTRLLEWSIIGENEDGRVVNFDTRLLGRRGVMHSKVITDPASIDTAIREFKVALRGYSYVPGEKYSEYTQGDKTAEYGLTALIVGSAAAVAVKTGLFKFLWKFVGVGAIAVVAAIGAFFRRLTRK